MPLPMYTEAIVRLNGNDNKHRLTMFLIVFPVALVLGSVRRIDGCVKALLERFSIPRFP